MSNKSKVDAAFKRDVIDKMKARTPDAMAAQAARSIRAQSDAHDDDAPPWKPSEAQIEVAREMSSPEMMRQILNLFQQAATIRVIMQEGRTVMIKREGVQTPATTEDFLRNIRTFERLAFWYLQLLISATASEVLHSATTNPGFIKAVAAGLDELDAEAADAIASPIDGMPVPSMRVVQDEEGEHVAELEPLVCPQCDLARGWRLVRSANTEQCAECVGCGFIDKVSTLNAKAEAIATTDEGVPPNTAIGISPEFVQAMLAEDAREAVTRSERPPESPEPAEVVEETQRDGYVVKDRRRRPSTLDTEESRANAQAANETRDTSISVTLTGEKAEAMREEFDMVPAQRRAFLPERTFAEMDAAISEAQKAEQLERERIVAEAIAAGRCPACAPEDCECPEEVKAEAEKLDEPTSQLETMIVEEALRLSELAATRNVEEARARDAAPSPAAAPSDTVEDGGRTSDLSDAAPSGEHP